MPAEGQATQVMIDWHIRCQSNATDFPGIEGNKTPVNEVPHLLDYQQNIFSKNALQKHHYDTAICFVNNLLNHVIYW